MGPKPSSPSTDALSIYRLDELINLKHPLVRRAGVIDWTEVERTFAVSFTSCRGRPALPPRLGAGPLYLQHAFDAAGEAVVNTCLENPYWQYFCGQVYLQTQAPIDPSSLTRWRQRIAEEGVETLLMGTIGPSGVVAPSVDRVIVDTTVMPKAIAHPTDSRLLEKSRQHLVKVAWEHDIALRQNYNRTAPRLAAQIGRYAHTPSSSSACTKPCGLCARVWTGCSARWRANRTGCPSKPERRSRIYWPHRAYLERAHEGREKAVCLART